MNDIQAKADRLDLINEVAGTLFDATNSWTEDGSIGGNIAYLLGSIAQESCIELFSDNPDHEGFVEILKETFPSGHKVWQFVEINAE